MTVKRDRDEQEKTKKMQMACSSCGIDAYRMQRGSGYVRKYRVEDYCADCAGWDQV